MIGLARQQEKNLKEAFACLVLLAAMLPTLRSLMAPSRCREKIGDDIWLKWFYLRLWGKFETAPRGFVLDLAPAARTSIAQSIFAGWLLSCCSKQSVCHDVFVLSLCLVLRLFALFRLVHGLQFLLVRRRSGLGRAGVMLHGCVLGRVPRLRVMTCPTLAWANQTRIEIARDRLLSPVG